MSSLVAAKWPTRAMLANRLCGSLTSFGTFRRPLPGVASDAARDTLVMQMVASIRRFDYTEILLKRPIDPARADPSSGLFDPERAAILNMRAGRTDEAIWLIFFGWCIGVLGATCAHYFYRR